MDRLTKHCIDENEDYYFYDKGFTQIKTRYDYEQVKDIGKLFHIYIEVIDKLGKFEDIMEKYHIKDLDELDKSFELVNKLCDAHEQSEFKKKQIALEKENQELKKQLENTIVPKFKRGQKVYCICNIGDNLFVAERNYICEVEDCIITDLFGFCNEKDKDKVFATEEEAEQKLKELKGKRN